MLSSTNGGVSGIAATEACGNEFGSVALAAKFDPAHATAGSATLRVQWESLTETVGFTGADVFYIAPDTDKGFFTGVESSVTVMAASGGGTPATGVTATVRYQSQDGTFVVAISTSGGATFPASGYFDITPVRATGNVAESMDCEASVEYTVSGASDENKVVEASSGSASSDFLWSWCPVKFNGAELTFAVKPDGAPQVTVGWDSITAAAGNPLSPQLRVAMASSGSGLFKAAQSTLLLNGNADHPVAVDVAADRGDITLVFTVDPTKPLPSSASSLTLDLAFVESLISCAAPTASSMTIGTSSAALSTVDNTNAPASLTVAAHTPRCPTLNNVALTQTGSGIKLAWNSFSNLDSLTLTQTMVKLKIAPAASAASVFSTTTSTPSQPVEVETGKSTHYAILTKDNTGIYVSFYQSGDADDFPQLGFVLLTAPIVSQCEITNALQELQPAAATGLGMYTPLVTFPASTPRCVSVFSGVHLTAPYDSDVTNKKAALEGSVGFRFSWTGFASQTRNFNDLAQFTFDSREQQDQFLLQDSTSAPADILDSTTDVIIADWTVSATVVSSVITLSFAYTGTGTAIFPTAAYVAVKPPRSASAFQCGENSLYSAPLTLPGVASFDPLNSDPNSLLARYVWTNCQLKFDYVKLTASVVDGEAKLGVSWKSFVVAEYNTAVPTFEIVHEVGTAVYAEAWGPQTLVLNSNVSVTATSVDSVTTLTFTLSDGATMPASADFAFTPPVNSSAHSCSATLSGVYTLFTADRDLALVDNLDDPSLLTTTARALACPSLSGMALSLAGSTFTVSWNAFSNIDNIKVDDFSAYTISLDTNAAVVFTGVVAATSTISLGGNAQVSVTFVNNNFHFKFSSVSGSNATTLPASGSFSFDADVSTVCSLTASYTLNVDDSTVSGFSGTQLTVSATSVRCAAYSGVSVTSSVLANTFNAVIAWTGFSNADNLSLAPSFRFAPPIGSTTDAFDSASATVTLFNIDIDANIPGIATVAVDAGAYVVSFVPTPQVPMPTNARLTLSLAVSNSATCDKTSTFTLSSAAASAVTLTPAASAAMSASYTSKPCPAIFTGLKLESNEMTLAGHKGFVVSWTGYSNQDNAALTDVFTVARSDSSLANPFAGAPAASIKVTMDDGVDDGNTKVTFAYNSATGAVTVSITLTSDHSLPTKGSIIVRPTLASGLVCDSDIPFTLTANAPAATAAAPLALAADLSTAVCTVVAGVKAAQTSVSASQLTLAVTYDSFTQGAAAGKITLSSSAGPANLYADNAALSIIVTADSFTTTTVTGSVASGVITLPLSAALPTAAGSLQFSLELAVTSDCDLTATLEPAAVGDISMSLDGSFVSLVTPGLACTYGWRCTGVTGDGLMCSASDPSQFGNTCSNDCGAGTLSVVPYCSRLNNGQYKSSATVDKCTGITKPTPTMSCADYTCPNAMWKCYAPGANADTMVACGNDDVAYDTCAHASGCHTNPAVHRVAVCVADSSSIADLGTNCPNTIPTKPAETKACASSLDLCAAQFDTEDECSNVNSQVVKCGVATRPGICINSVSGATLADALCAEASVSLKQTCVNIPSDCSTLLIWVSQQSATCVTSTEPLCKSIRTQTSQCAFVNAGNTVTAAQYICDGVADKPPAFVDCDAPAVTCAVDRGACYGYESFTVEGEVQQNVLATCVCGTGFFDASCISDITLSSLTAAWDSTARSIDLTWATNAAHAASAAGVQVAVRVTPPGYMTSINAGQVFIGDLATSVSAPALQLFPGTHTVTLFLTTLISVSTTVVVGSLCDVAAGMTHSCLHGGSCDSATGQCSCVGSWSGAYCAVSPCAAADCNSANAKNPSCSVVDNEAQCNCRTAADGTALFRDAKCNEAIDTTCAGLTCANDGIPLTLFNQSSNAFECANKCTCPETSIFTGDLCDACKNVCNAAGTADSNADECTCTCKPGYTGEGCDSRFANLRLVFPLSALAFLGKATEAEELALWSSTTKADLVTLGGLSTVAYSVANLSTVATKKGKFVNVLISAGPAQASHDMTDTYAALHAILSALITSQGSTSTTLSSAVHTNVGISDDGCGESCSDVPMGTGTGMMLADATTDTDTDPNTDTGTNTEDGGSASDKSSDNHADIIAGVVVGVGGFLVVLAVVLIAWYKKLWCFSQKGTASKSADIEMTGIGTSNYDV